jgi:hypothetical protein
MKVTEVRGVRDHGFPSKEGKSRHVSLCRESNKESRKAGEARKKGKGQEGRSDSHRFKKHRPITSLGLGLELVSCVLEVVPEVSQRFMDVPFSISLARYTGREITFAPCGLRRGRTLRRP